MAKGSALIAVRVGSERRQRMLELIEQVNQTRAAEPYTLSSWVLAAIDEALDKPARRKRAAEKKKRK